MPKIFDNIRMSPKGETKKKEVVTMNDYKKDRVRTLKAMHEIIQSMNNEAAYFNHWVITVPDMPSEEDFEFISREEYKDLYSDAVEMFFYIMKRYLKDGLFIGGDLYKF